MEMCEFNPCCGCVDLDTGTKILGFLTVIIKLARLVEMGFLIYMSLLVHVFMTSVPITIEILFVMPVVCAVVIVLQLVFLILFLVRLFKNEVKSIGKLFVINAVCFAIECVAMLTFLVLLVLDAEFSSDVRNSFIVGDVFATVWNLYFLVLLRSCLVEDAKKSPLRSANSKDPATIPFARI